MTLSANILHTPPQNSANKLVTDSNDRVRYGRFSARSLWSSYPGRIAAIVTLFVVGYGSVYAGVIDQAASGSRVPMLALAPALTLLAATGYRHAPHGVPDNESDWIFVVLMGGVVATGLWLLGDRYPTLTGLWQLELQGAVLWAVCCAMILLGLRHTARMWRVWVFAVVASAPTLHQLAAAALGGSDTAVAQISVAFGCVAAYLAATQASRRQRLIITALCAALGWAAVALLLPRTALFTTVLVAGAAIPVLILFALRRWAHPSDHAPGSRYPTRSWRSLVGLAVIAIALALLNTPRSAPPAPALVEADWSVRAGLAPSSDIPFITDFLGPHATMTRFDLPEKAGFPAAAVDVITTDDPAALRDYHDAVWYPSSRALTYRPVESSVVAMREIHSDADTATRNSTPEWYALTWVWRTGDAIQQVTVIVNQNPTASTVTPPLPQPLSVTSTVIEPLLWHSRQQTDLVGEVAAPVIERARDIAVELITAGNPRGA